MSQNPKPRDTVESDNLFWQLSEITLFQHLKSTSQGLSSEEANRKLIEFGPNTLKADSQRPLRQFLSRFANPLVLILLAASAVSAISGEIASFVLISLMVLLSVTLDFFQQYQAEKAADQLKKLVEVRATVLRNGRATEVPFADVVLGDIVFLSAGDLIPADGVILQAKDLFLNQALLTGESYPVEKIVASEGSAEAQVFNAPNAVLMGTSVVSGSGQMLVCKTGGQTSMGEIAQSLSQAPPPTAFDTGLARFGYLIMRLTIALVMFVVLVNTYFHRPLLESFLFAIALAVGLTPELLPMIVTVTLSRGALRMQKKHVIIKKLSAIQNLGAIDVLCSDKTGTLTEGKIILERHVDINNVDSKAVLKFGYLNSFFETGLKSPIDQAILEHEEIDISGWLKIDEVPFDFERRRVSILTSYHGQKYLIVKGAVEEILDLSQSYVIEESEIPLALDESAQAKIVELRNSLERDGFRTIGIAWKKVPLEQEHAQVSDESQLVFSGVAAFYDPPKAGIKEVLSRLMDEQNVSFKVVTGDSELVTRHLFETIGIEVTGILTGAEIQKMSQEALKAQVETTNLFCRVSPAQKDHIIHMLRSRGHTVGYIGDGINDAPSLHSADVGVSVEGAVDVAKDAADIILLKKDLSVLNEGVLEGRRTHLNIMKYIMMGASSNLGNMISMAGATLILPFLPMLPIQILLNNFLYDVSEVTIPMDEVDTQRLQKPQHWNIKFIHRFMWAIGLVSSLFDFLTFYVLRTIFHANEAQFHTGWFIESIATQVLVIFVIRTRFRPWQSRPSLALTLTSVSVVILATLLPYTILAKDLGFMPLTLEFLAVLVVMVLCYLALVEIVKAWFFRKFTKN
ncbi:MAG: magnesium-translocating P-type ATPase [Pseudobdellovibrionaceae bacterium]